MSSCGKGGVENRRAIGAPVNKLIIPPGEEEESIYIYICCFHPLSSSTTIYDDSPWYLSRLICRDENLPRHRFSTFLSSVFPSKHLSFETNDFNDFFSDISISLSSILLFFRETKSRVSRIMNNNHRIEELKTFFLGFLHD